MSENPTPEENSAGQTLADELINLGNNLSDLLRTAWDNPERKRVQGEFEDGLNEFADLLKREAESFSDSETGQRLKSDIGEFSERIRTAETREKVRLEVLNIMQNANAELRKVIDKWSPPTTDDTSVAEESQTTDVTDSQDEAG